MNLEQQLLELKQALDTTSIVAMTDAKGSITYVNDKFCEISQYPRDELMGKNHSLLNSGTHPKTMWTEMYRTVSEGKPWHEQVCNRAKSGSLYWVDTTIIAYRDELGKINRYVGIRTDITKQKLLEQELIEQNRALDTTSIVAMTDARGTITYVNDKFCQISQYSRDELLGQNHSLLNSGTHPKSMWTQMYRTVSQGKSWHEQVCNRTKAGTLYWVDTTIVAYRDEQGKINRYVGIRTDITKQKLLEQALREAKELAEKTQIQAETANHAKSDFLANMSHELRTPMHGILSFSAFGIKKIDTAKRTKLGQYFTNIHLSGERLLALINDLLDLSKIEAGKMVLNLKETNVMTVLNNCQLEQAQRMHDLGLTMEIDAPDTAIIARFDAIGIGQVITNILSNAIKFSPENSVIRVTIKQNAQQALCFSMKDSGLGIPENEIENVFDAFIQSSKTKTGAGGTGLGLAISKKIIQAHSGRIWAENNKDKGAIFSFIIPNMTG
jgi:PAS domain S-box-containing protein